MDVKKLTILGSTGSIGTQALEVLSNLENKNSYEIQGMTAGSNFDLFVEQVRTFNPKKICIQEESHSKQLKSIFPDKEVLFGDEGVVELAKDNEIDILLTGTSGKVALKPTIEALKNGKTIALANKETLVMAGDIVMQTAREFKGNILPVDSEHSAIHQSLSGNKKDLNKIIITASGGPFLNKTKEEIAQATLKDALNHPKWNMGKKITIDSSTLMNKGLEVIEAHYLFDIPYEKIEVVIHPQSIVHSAVEFNDGSIIAQIGEPSMHIPIQYALTYPNRAGGVKTNSFSFVGKNLTFDKPDFERFPCLGFAFEAGKIGATAPTVLNAANEIAVHRFLQGEIKLIEIIKIVETALSNHTVIKNPTLDEIFAIDTETRLWAQNVKFNTLYM